MATTAVEPAEDADAEHRMVHCLCGFALKHSSVFKFSAAACALAGLRLVILIAALPASAWEVSRVVWASVVLGLMGLQLFLARLTATPSVDRLLLAFSNLTVLLLIAPYHPIVNQCSTPDQLACQYLTPLWLMGLVVVLPWGALQTQHLGWAWLATFVSVGLAISGLVLWLQPLLRSGSPADAAEGLWMLLLLLGAPTMTFVQYVILRLRGQTAVQVLNPQAAFSAESSARSRVQSRSQSRVRSRAVSRSSSSSVEKFDGRIVNGCFQLVKHRFDGLLCLNRGLYVMAGEGQAVQLLGEIEGHWFPDLVTDEQSVAQHLRRVADDEPETTADVQCVVKAPGRGQMQFRMTVTCVGIGAESSGRGNNVHLVIGIEAPELDLENPPAAAGHGSPCNAEYMPRNWETVPEDVAPVVLGRTVEEAGPHGGHSFESSLFNVNLDPAAVGAQPHTTEH